MLVEYIDNSRTDKFPEPTMPLKILYDISWLGLTRYNKSKPTGLSRVVECTAEALLQMPDCSVRLCAGHSAEAYDGASTYLKESKRFRQEKLSPRHFKAQIGGSASTAIRRGAKRWSPRRGTGFLHRLAAKTAELTAANQNLVSQKDLQAAHIYHAQYLGVPPSIRENRKLKFISTVYDLIPIKFPGTLPVETLKPFSDLIQSIDVGDHVICISARTKDDLCNYRPDLDPSRVSVAYLGASSSFRPCRDQSVHQRVRSKYSIPSEPYLLTVGTLAPHKNFARLIESFGALLHDQRIENLNLVITGNAGWKTEQLRESLARWQHLARRIIFTGFAAEDDLPGLYGGALAFVFPSIYEGFGLPVLEAMQCGTPVVCSNSSSIPEVAGDAALYFDPLEKDEISAALLTIYQDERLRRSLAEKALHRATMFTWRRCAEQTIQAYQRAITSDGPL